MISQPTGEAIHGLLWVPSARRHVPGCKCRISMILRHHLSSSNIICGWCFNTSPSLAYLSCGDVCLTAALGIKGGLVQMGDVFSVLLQGQTNTWLSASALRYNVGLRNVVSPGQ